MSPHHIDIVSRRRLLQFSSWVFGGWRSSRWAPGFKTWSPCLRKYWRSRTAKSEA